MSTFSGISTALSALYAQRRALDVAGQNIANINTEGYSRQRADLQSVGAPAVPSMFAVYDDAGGGVDVNSVERLRDTFLEQRGRSEHSQGSYLEQRKTDLAGIERVVGNLGDTGLSHQLSDLWASFSDVANRPRDLAARNQLLQQAGTVASTLSEQSAVLGDQWAAQRQQVGTLVTEVNTTASTIADLNLAVQRATSGGLPSNELQDRRDGLAMKLAELTGATVRNGADGSLDVYLGGSALVRGATTEAVTVTGATELTGLAGNPVGLSWAADGRPADVPGGTLSAATENLNTTLPDFRTQLDTVAAALVTKVNDVHTAGYDLAGTAGTPLFTGTTAATIAVAITDPALIAASGTTGTANLDGSNADKLAALAKDPTGPDAAFRSLMVRVGSAAKTATMRSSIQDTVTAAADSARDSVSGVNLDEEMTNMLAAQRAYEGAARVMTAVDSMLDTLINRTGLVGR
ncbi:MAG TPA: flagellar hook-associated protein FlgK [Mycobacteriales bacterium]|jgi:flagellar hook-associated protein 1 FlgK